MWPPANPAGRRIAKETLSKSLADGRWNGSADEFNRLQKQLSKPADLFSVFRSGRWPELMPLLLELGEGCREAIGARLFLLDH